MKKLIVIATACLTVLACKKTVADNGFEALDTLVKPASFEKEIEGKKTALYTLKNDSGMVVKITNFGGRVVSILVPDKNGNYADVCIGLKDIEGYITDDNFYGAAVGRYANRIGGAIFKLDEKEYKLTANNGNNSLHGGPQGFYAKVWDAEQHGDTLSLSYTSPDMEEGFPGTLTVHLNYILTNNNELIFQFEATTDKKTVVNLTNHAYYNLRGEGNGDILGHELEIFADKITPVNKELITDGSYTDVKGTAFDFIQAHKIGERINDTTNQQIVFGGGYDHNWVLNKTQDSLQLAMRLTEPESGRVMELYTTEPGLQFYSGNFMDGKDIGKSGKTLNHRSAACFEPQHYPNTPNVPSYPSAVLEPGKTYKHTSVLKFYAKK